MIQYLYNLKEDFNESHDLAAQYPGKVKELLKEFDKEARKHNVYPLKSGKNADAKNYPEVTRTHYDILTGARGWGEYPYFDGTLNKPFTISVYIDEGGPSDSGMLICQKAWALFVRDGKPVFVTAGGSRLVSDRPLPEGACVVKAVADHKPTFTSLTLFIDDTHVGNIDFKGRLNITGKSNAINVGRSWGVSVSGDYESPFYFTGKIFKASIDVER